MSYLLDTNVVSEFANNDPHANVVNWFQTHRNSDFFLSVITIGEIQQGIARLPLSKRRERLTRWFNEAVLGRYADFILPVDTVTMLEWGILTGDLIKIGRKLPVMDSIIAAVALQHNLTLVTRNVADFSNIAIELINPWE